MYPFTAHADVKRHASTPRSDALSCTWRTYLGCGISVSRPHLEGAVWLNGHPRGRFRLQQGSVDQSCGSHLQGFPSARRCRTEEACGVAEADEDQGKHKGEACATRCKFLFPPSDTTRPAFLQNAMALEAQGERTQYLNMPEVEMANGMCGGHRQVSQMLRNIYDRQRAGALRATADGVTGNPLLRANITLSATPVAARSFFKSELFNGTFGRMVFSYKARNNRDGRIPRQGKYSDEFYQKLDSYLVRLDICKGRYIIPQLNKLADKMAEDMASLADLTDDDILWDCSKRAIVSAWKAGCIMWVLNNQTWTRSMGELVEWLVYRDLWSKMQLFADMLSQDADVVSEAQRRGPKNMLDDLPNEFNEQQLEALRTQMGKSKEGTKNQLYKWVFRKFITYNERTGLYTKSKP